MIGERGNFLLNIYFPECLIQNCGSTATREPSQVFSLLETVFSSFDSIAKDLRIFKVETVGDCYVAACGLPQPRKDHAVAMARYVLSE